MVSFCNGKILFLEDVKLVYWFDLRVNFYCRFWSYLLHHLFWENHVRTWIQRNHYSSLFSINKQKLIQINNLLKNINNNLEWINSYFYLKTLQYSCLISTWFIDFMLFVSYLEIFTPAAGIAYASQIWIDES